LERKEAKEMGKLDGTRKESVVDGKDEKKTLEPATAGTRGRGVLAPGANTVRFIRMRKQIHDCNTAVNGSVMQ
jgi:hypothetical protein